MIAGLDAQFVMIAVGAFVAVAGLGWVLTSGDDATRKRVGAVAARSGGGGRRVRQTSALDQSAMRRKQVQESLKELEARQKDERRQSMTIKSQIAQAGLNWNVRTFYIACAGIALAAAAGIFVSGQSPLIAAAAGFVAGFGLPRWVLGFLRGRRTKKFSQEFANAIDIIVRGVKSGLPVNECLKIIAAESPDPVGPEFAKLVEGQAMGISLDEGLRKMYQRMPLAEVSFFGIVLAIQQKTGGNLAEALSNLSTVLRARKMMREKISAMSSEAKASSSIIGSLPPGVAAIVYVTTPSYMSLMFTHPMGQMMTMGGLLWMGMGIFIMKKMIDFKF